MVWSTPQHCWHCILEPVRAYIYNIVVIMEEMNLFETTLGINEDFYEVGLDDYGRIITLSFYDQDYDVFRFEGNLIQALVPFTSLQTLEIEVSAYTITDIDGLSGFKSLEHLTLTDCCEAIDI